MPNQYRDPATIAYPDFFDIVFNDRDAALAVITARRWPNGVSCPKCGADGLFNHQSRASKNTGPRYRCLACGLDFNVYWGTPWYNAKTAPQMYLRAEAMFRAGISPHYWPAIMNNGYKECYYMAVRFRANGGKLI